jgi:glycosyltransferase involved in cell wall biosynthesis
MNRVGFVMNFAGPSWLGGVSYFRNLLAALARLPDPKIEPVIVTGRDSASISAARALWPATPIASRTVVPGRPVWKMRRALQRYIGRDLIFERLANRHGVTLLSHSGHLGRRASVPTLPWIPDFQERHYPRFFTAADIEGRARNIRDLAQHSTAILLSSHVARADLLAIDPRLSDKVEVLRFVADVPSSSETPDPALVAAKLAVNRPYFLLPNQFWAHKNHAVIVDALARLRASHADIMVVATGNTSDHRQPDHFQALMQRVVELRVENNFRVVGTVPYADLMALMRGCVAVVNPSLFEGWSTSVEEAKSMGKAMVLSDIPVHREQNSANFHYFAPADPDAAAEALRVAWSSWNPTEDRARQTDAAGLLDRRRNDFAQTYEEIALRTIARRRPGGL